MSKKKRNILYPDIIGNENLSSLPPDPMQIATDNYALLNEGLVVRVETRFEHNRLLSNSILGFYIFLSALIFYLHYKAAVRKAALEERETRLEMDRLQAAGRVTVTDGLGHETITWFDHRGEPTERYPLNPNGSPRGLTGATTTDGRVTIMMPHPERAADPVHGGTDGRDDLGQLARSLQQRGPGPALDHQIDGAAEVQVDEAGARRHGRQLVGRRLGRVAAHRLATVPAVGSGHPRVQQLEIVVYLGHRADRRAGGPDPGRLIDGDGGRYSGDDRPGDGRPEDL